MHPDDLDFDLEHIQAGINKGVSWDIEHRLLLTNGLIKWVRAIGKPILDENGKTKFIIGIVQDISETKLAEETIRRSQKMDALGKLTGGIAHDYNNMLGVILGYVQLLAPEFPEDSKYGRYIKEIDKAAERSRDLTKKLLGFSRFKIDEVESININALLLNIKSLLEKALTPAHQLIFDLAEEELIIETSKGEFGDAVINMAINAKHAMSDGGSFSVETSTFVVDALNGAFLSVDEGVYLQLVVADTGIGMDMATQGKIFDPFFTTKGDTGTGLGLSQVYGLIQRSNGAIKVYSELGEGTKFIIHIPLTQPQIDVSRNSHSEDVVDDKRTKGHSEVILIVDDEVALLRLAGAMLEGNGYQVLTAENGEEALIVLANKKVDLVLSDVLMPKMGGYELLECINKQYPSLPVQLTSGFTDKQKVSDNQFILLKPYTIKTLLSCVNSLLIPSGNDANR